MNQVVANFLGHVLEQIKYKKIHPYIRQELEDHIESLKEAYEKEGLTEEAAYEKAITQMGDATIVGKELHEKHKPRCEWSLLILFSLLIGIGLFALARMAPYYTDEYRNQDFIKQLLFVGMGSVVFSIFYFCDYKRLERSSLLLYGLGVALMVSTINWGLSINGKTQFLRIAFIMFYTTSLSMPLLVIGYIGLVRRWAYPKLKNFLALGAVGMISSLMMVQISNIPTGIGIGAIFTIVLTLYILGNEYVGNKMRTLVYTYSALGVGGILMLFMLWRGTFLKEYQVARLNGFLHPEEDPRGMGYLYNLLKSIREDAHLIGKTDYFKEILPDRCTGALSSDMTFTFIVGNMGWIMGGLVILFLLLAIIRLFRAASRVQDNYGRILALSIACIFTVQFVFNMGMNLGYMPIMSSSLPFISYGGSRLITNMGLLGLFMGIYRKKDLVLVMPQGVDKEGTLFSKLLG